MDNEVIIETVNVELKVGKESKEVADFLSALIMDIKDGKKIEAITENIQGLMTAVEGYDKLDDEQRHESKHGTRAYLAMEISKAIDYKPLVPKA